RRRTLVCPPALHDALPIWGLASLLVGRADDLREIDEPVRVAPLVVVPAEDLHEAADRLREAAVEDAARRRAHDVARHERGIRDRSEEHTSELPSRENIVCR